MLARLREMFSKERRLRMVWEARKRGLRSRLVGTAHFFPYHFRGSLRRYIGQAAAVLVEGPLDENAMRKVVAAGSTRSQVSLHEALDAATVRKISREVGVPPPPLSTHQLYRDLLFGESRDWLGAELEGLKPWMGFMQIWNRYRTPNGWTYSLDLDAARIAAELGKPVHAMETIEEQIGALDAVPLERIVNFLRNVDWDSYAKEYVRRYLAGHLEALVATARAFPTYCEPIVGRRDPILFERMTPFFERGNAIAFFGVLHCQGIIAMLRAEGYEVNQLAGD